jgi:hypothetical protein
MASFHMWKLFRPSSLKTMHPFVKRGTLKMMRYYCGYCTKEYAISEIGKNKKYVRCWTRKACQSLLSSKIIVTLA